jgi:hypothetical protein
MECEQTLRTCHLLGNDPDQDQERVTPRHLVIVDLLPGDCDAKKIANNCCTRQNGVDLRT